MGTDAVDRLLDPELARPGCPVERTLEVLDGKWTTLVIRDLLSGPKRFTQLRRSLGNPSAKTLTERLRALEHRGVLTRTVYAEVPPRVVYELTGRGMSLRSVLAAMLAWGEDDTAARPAGDQPSPPTVAPPAFSPAGSKGESSGGSVRPADARSPRAQ
jgi:DNA-binding HxlR family transcriptional regulator